MTVIVSILCSDGVVLASDSMITNSIGEMGTTETKGKKVYDLGDDRIFAFCNDSSLATRARLVLEADQSHHGVSDLLEYSVSVSQKLINHFHSTHHPFPLGLEFLLGCVVNDEPRLIQFNGNLQPTLLDEIHYWRCVGSGKQFADPFLKFLTDVFCPNKQPTVKVAKWLAYWAIEHTIDTNVGGVNGPIQITVLEKEGIRYLVKESDGNDLDYHATSLDAAKKQLSRYRNEISGDPEDTGAMEPKISIPELQAAL